MTQKRVLIVEDDPADAKMIADLLTEDSNSEYIPFLADRLDTAIDQLTADQFDVVILDLALPDVNGLEAIREISFILPHLPIVVLTEVEDDAFTLQAVQLGAQESLVKKLYTGLAIRRALRYAIERKRLEERIFQMATRDSLTQLPNRYLVIDRLAHAIEHANRAAMSVNRGENRSGDRGGNVAILLLDLDNFRSLNDTMGHPIGDRLLVDVAQRLKNGIRRSDTIGRMGGDEFILILEDIVNPHTIENAAQRILHSFAVPFVLDDHSIVITASIGVSVYPAHAATAEELLKGAEIAMYAAKKDHNSFRYYTGK